MNINKLLNQKIPFLFSFFVALFLFFSDMVILSTMLKKDNVLGVSTKSKVEKVKKSNNSLVGEGFSKSDVNSHVSKVKNTVLEIKKIAKTEKEVGKVEVGEEIIEFADEISYASVDNINSLDEVAERPAWKNFLLGPDYKNLGQIRSNLVQTRNQIRKIEKTMEKNMGEEESNTLRARLGELEEERLRIFNYIDERDDGFSLFGWLAKLMSGYNKNIEEEEGLGQEVEITKEEGVGEDLPDELNENEISEEKEDMEEVVENIDTKVLEEPEKTETEVIVD